MDWPSVHCTVHSLPHLFQVWASKHVLDIAGTKKFLTQHQQDSRGSLCPSCKKCEEMFQHIATHPEAERTEAFTQSMQKV